MANRVALIALLPRSVVELIKAGCEASIADDYSNLHYHVTMAWTAKYGRKLDPETTTLAQAADHLTRGWTTAMVLADIGFHHCTSVLEYTGRELEPKAVADRKKFVDDMMASCLERIPA